MSIGLFDQDAVDDRGTDVWQYVSASRLNCWLRCPLAFKLRYIDGIRSPPTAALFVGKSVHAALECFYRHRQLGLTIGADELQRRMVESWGEAVEAEEAVFDSVADEEAFRRQASSLVNSYLAEVGDTEPRPLAVEASVETPLIDPMTGEDFGIPLLGVMDLVLPEETGPVIADFKTAAKSSEPLEISHELQLSCYAYLFRQATDGEEAGLEIRSLVKTKTPQVHFHRYPARDYRHFQRLFAVIRAYLDDLDSGRFVFRPGWGCASCEFCHGPCRDWSGC
jgi:putative RecB family exonuclease